jgi:hypothetical protein
MIANVRSEAEKMIKDARKNVAGMQPEAKLEAVREAEPTKPPDWDPQEIRRMLTSFRDLVQELHSS